MPLHLAVNGDRLIVSSYGYMFRVTVRAAGWRTSLSSISLARWRAQRDSKIEAQKLAYPRASGAWWNVLGERAPALVTLRVPKTLFPKNEAVPRCLALSMRVEYGNDRPIITRGRNCAK